MIEDSLWIITSIVIIIILLIVFPVMHALEKQDEMIQIELMNQVDQFLHDIKSNGQLTRASYEQFNARLARLGNHFSVKIEHHQRLYTPIYDDPLDETTFSGDIATVYDLVSNEMIIEQLYDAGNAEKTYYFKRGDFVTISVNSTLRSKYDKMRDLFLLLQSETPTFYVRLSGMVAHETN